MNKGLDNSFLHYGVRKQDLALIAELCKKHELDEDWVINDIIKSFHEQKVSNIEVDEKAAAKIISKALLKIKQ